MTEQPTRAELYRKAQVVFHDDPPWACLAHNLQVVVTQSSVNGWILYPNTRHDFRSVTISQAAQ